MNSRRRRDSQRSRVYAWERQLKALGVDVHQPEFKTLEECEAFLAPIWSRERGRVGRANVPMPAFARNLWGCRSAAGSSTWHEIKLPLWARSRWVILHEAAHILCGWHEGHGSRFVGLLIGMAARHMQGFDAQAAIDLAAEMGVKVDLRTVGMIPILREPTLADRILPHLPGRITQLAWRIGCRPSQVRGAALTLIRRGEARYFRHRLVAISGIGAGN